MIQQRYWQKSAEQVRGLHMAPRVQGTRISFTSWRKSLEVDSGYGLHNSLYASRWDLEFFSTISVIIFFCCLYIYLPATLYNASSLWNTICITTMVTILYVLHGCYYNVIYYMAYFCSISYACIYAYVCLFTHMHKSLLLWTLYII